MTASISSNELSKITISSGDSSQKSPMEGTVKKVKFKCSYVDPQGFQCKFKVGPFIDTSTCGGCWKIFCNNHFIRPLHECPVRTIIGRLGDPKILNVNKHTNANSDGFNGASA
jgi:hypothetical protein